MQTGKLPPALLRDRILSKLGVKRAEVVVPAALGEDSSVLDLGGDLCVLSTDPITGAGSEIGWLAVHVSCNDVASNGAEPVGVLLTILVPEHWELSQLEELMGQADLAAREVGVQIIGGHTEVTPGIPEVIVCSTVVGRAERENMVISGGLNPGDVVIATKGVGFEGTAILAMDYAEQLRSAGVADDVIERAVSRARQLSIVPEARIAQRKGATAMHDVTEGGILGALYELASASGVGIEVQPGAMPVLPETRAVCETFGADPLRLIGSGSLLVGCPPGQAATDMLDALKEAGIEAAVVATALGPSGGYWIRRENGRFELEPPESDELWRVKSRLSAGGL